MTIVSEIEYLLPFVSESEKTLFERMYPEGVGSIPNKKHALDQIKQTLMQRTNSIERLRTRSAEYEDKLKELDVELSALIHTCSSLESEIIELKYTPTPTVEKDSLWLTSLEHAGVDNWDGYDYAQELYARYKKESIA